MLPFILYFAAGAVTAFHVYVLVGIGKALNVLEFVSLLGSVCLIVSGYISLFKPSAAAKLALVASLAAWCFYAPGIAATAKAGWHGEVSEPRMVALTYIAIALLALATIYPGLVSFRTSKVDESRTWLFPGGAGRSARIGVGVCTVLAAIGLSAWLIFGVHNSRRLSSRFLIPDGYVGWVKIEFQVLGATPVPAERDQYVFKIPANGMLRTSSPERYGWGQDEYYYENHGALRRLPTDADGRLIWGKVNGEHGSSSGPRQFEEFFVGTEQQFREMAGEKEIGPRPMADSPK